MKYLYLISFTLILGACTSYNYDNPYYGYSNSQDVVEDEEDYDDNGWVNPMSDQNNQQNSKQNLSNNQNLGTNYVPVIVPWWNGYYGWGNTPRSRYGFYGYYSNYWGPEWYSPWYSYHPYYGVTWQQHWYDNHYHNRYWLPNSGNSYTDRPIKNSPRNFGNSRDNYSVYNPRRTDNTITNPREYNPRTTRYTSNGENVFKRGENYEVRYGNRNNNNNSRRRESSEPSYSQPNYNTNSNNRGNSNVSEPRNSNSNTNRNTNSGNNRGGNSRGGNSRGGNSRGK